MINFVAQPVIKNKLLLGEGAVWDKKSSLLYYVDILGQKVFSYNPKTLAKREFFIGQDVGTVVLSDKGKLILATNEGILELDPTNLKKEILIQNGEKP